MSQDTTGLIRSGVLVRDLPDVGTSRSRGFSRLGIHTVGDLIRHLPTRYERQWAEGGIADLPMNALGAARGVITATRSVGMGRRSRFEATLEDHGDRLLLTWFNSAYLRGKIKPGMTVRVQGKTQAFRSQAQMVNPGWEVLEDPDQAEITEDRLRPVYPATERLGSRAIEQLIDKVLPVVLPTLEDPLPESIVRRRAMPPLADAFRMAHQPKDADEHKAARRRLAFNELLLLELGIVIKRHFNRTRVAASALRCSPAIDEHIRQRFRFTLTEAQERVIRELTDDLQQGHPMNRLLQGDVGSGKTVVALYALLVAAANRKQGALMAPTEVLAEQHYLSISDLLAGSNVRIELLTGGMSSSGSMRRRVQLQKIRSGQVDIVIGTQALLAESVRFNDLAVVVIDEQHRFGVAQRATLRDRALADEGGASQDGDAPLLESVGDSPVGGSGGEDTSSDGERAVLDSDSETPAEVLAPHHLVMTATPIPRTLSLTVFGDLDVSVIDELPPGRGPITTRVVAPDQAHEVYAGLVERIERGEQAYVVVPAIDESGQETDAALKSVHTHAELLKDRYFPDYEVAAIHGRLKRARRESMMARFRGGAVHVLVATTVIEVGVDVPNATAMVVEHADRFGLAQLHQLRGRIGRGGHGKPSLCVFVADPTTEPARQRMEAIASTTDGFKISEHDLNIRGMGDFFGTRQHGLPPLRVAVLPDDLDLLKLARRDAESIIEADPTLLQPEHRLLRKLLGLHYGEALSLIDVG